LVAGCVAALTLGGCAQTEFAAQATKKIEGAGGVRSPSASGAYKVGNPYQIDGVWYYPAEDYAYDETGIASWYGPDFHGKLTASGERYDMNDVTAAHKTLPMPSMVRVTNLENGRSLVMRVNDRGPFVRGRIIDLSRRSAQLLGVHAPGTAKVRVQILPEESKQVKTAALAGVRGNVVVASAEPVTVGPPPIVPTSAPVTVAPPPLPPPLTAPPLAAPPVVSVEPVKPTAIFVQAGAFVRQDNAQRLRNQLAGYGPAKVSATKVGTQDFYRVRIGPLASVDEADRVLDRVVSNGHPAAKIVVE
jgi:rare lipoprotein A